MHSRSVRSQLMHLREPGTREPRPCTPNTGRSDASAGPPDLRFQGRPSPPVVTGTYGSRTRQPDLCQNSVSGRCDQGTSSRIRTRRSGPELERSGAVSTWREPPLGAAQLNYGSSAASDDGAMEPKRPRYLRHAEHKNRTRRTSPNTRHPPFTSCTSIHSTHS